MINDPFSFLVLIALDYTYHRTFSFNCFLKVACLVLGARASILYSKRFLAPTSKKYIFLSDTYIHTHDSKRL